MTSNIHLIWILDNSNSMKAKGKINSVNMVIRETIPLISDLSKDYKSYNFYNRTLVFSTGARWIDQKFKKMQEYSWNDLEAGGKSDLGAAFEKIREIFEGESQKSTVSDSYFFVLITDGYPTDNWAGSLEDLYTYKDFAESRKIAIRIQDTEEEILTEFTGQKKREKGLILGIDDIERIPMSIISCIDH